MGTGSLLNAFLVNRIDFLRSQRGPKRRNEATSTFIFSFRNQNRTVSSINTRTRLSGSQHIDNTIPIQCCVPLSLPNSIIYSQSRPQRKKSDNGSEISNSSFFRKETVCVLSFSCHFTAYAEYLSSMRRQKQTGGRLDVNQPSRSMQISVGVF